MGRNFHSVCHQCKVTLMHFRRKEGDLMQQFAYDHKYHENQTAIYNDYIEEPPEDYTDVFDTYHGVIDLRLDNPDVDTKA